MVDFIFLFKMLYTEITSGMARAYPCSKLKIGNILSAVYIVDLITTFYPGF